MSPRANAIRNPGIDPHFLCRHVRPMANFVLILVCLGAGILLRSFHKFPVGSAGVLNRFVIFISLPALILVHVPALLSSDHIGLEALVPASMAWIHFGLACLIFLPLARVRQWSPAKTGALTLTAGLGNTSFVGFPVLDAFLGAEGIQVGVLADQLGSFLTISTVGLWIAARCSGHQLSLLMIARRVVLFPPFLALLAAMAWYGSGTSGPGILHLVFESLAATLVPLALVSVGLQLRINWDVLQRRWPDLAFGLGFKLILAPAALFLIYALVFDIPQGLILHATILEAAMPPMVTAAMIASEYQLDSEIANLMVGVGIAFAILTLPAWNWLMGSGLLL